MKKSGFLVSLLVVGGIFAVVWRLRGDSNGAENNPSEAGSTTTNVAAGVSGTSPQGGPTATVARTGANELFDSGVKAAQAGDIATAKKKFADAMKRFPSEPAAARGAVKLAMILRKEGDDFEARNVLSAALAGLNDGHERQEVVKLLDRLNGELVFSRKKSPDSITYTVKSGDALARIGKAYRITPEFIKRINYLTSNLIHPGDQLKVFQGPFDIVIEKAKFRLGVYRNGIFIKEYLIGLGKNDSTPTPEGEFVVTNKMIDPAWDPQGPEFAAAGAPDNPLGTRWIEFAPHYGIHGTIEPKSIGKEASRGCIRLLNREVEELYDLVTYGSNVTIRP